MPVVGIQRLPGSVGLVWALGLWLGGFCLAGGVFSGFRDSAELILTASFSRAEKEDQVGGLAFEL